VGIIAWIGDEPGASAMQGLLERAESGEFQLFMSIFNVGETCYILARRRSLAVAEQFLNSLASLPIHIEVPDREGVMAAARVKASHAVAYGDSFAIALAQNKGGSVITGDDEIRRCALVPVDWIGMQPSGTA
jgi:predicted nucleic acid-binding protein